MPGVQLRVDKVMDVTISREVERLERRLTFLATVGSTAPFVGLFGTVWGIMTSFQAIAVSKNTNLAVVAPGIAEALVRDRARPARRDSGGDFLQQIQQRGRAPRGRLEGFADEFAAILSRQIDKTREGLSMGAGLQAGGALANRRARRRSARPMGEINVTPMVDVMLVLLIIFMVTAPLLTVGVDDRLPKPDLPKVDLPKTEAGADRREKEPLTITVDPDGKIFLQKTEISFDEIVPKLTAISERGCRRADLGARGRPRPLRQITKVMARIKAAGFPVDAGDRPSRTKSTKERRRYAPEHFHLGRAACGDPALGRSSSFLGRRIDRRRCSTCPVDLPTPSEVTKLKAGMVDAKDEAPLAGKPKEQKPEAVKEAEPKPEESAAASRRRAEAEAEARREEGRSRRTSPSPKRKRKGEGREAEAEAGREPPKKTEAGAEEEARLQRRPDRGAAQQDSRCIERADARAPLDDAGAEEGARAVERDAR